jgi:hypothetical protein
MRVDSSKNPEEKRGEDDEADNPMHTAGNHARVVVRDLGEKWVSVRTHTSEREIEDVSRTWLLLLLSATAYV